MLFNAVNGNGPRRSQFCALQGWNESTWNKRVDESRMISMALPTGIEPVFPD